MAKTAANASRERTLWRVSIVIAQVLADHHAEASGHLKKLKSAFKLVRRGTSELVLEGSRP
jgi:hypothetical protein